MLNRRAAVLLALATALSAPATVSATAPDAGSSAPACRVTNLDTNDTQDSLQQAVTLAVGGQQLTVEGTCIGVTEIGKSLRIRGVATTNWGTPTLDGDRKGRVLTIEPSVSVVIDDLRIRNGTAADGGGVMNRGTLILRGASVIEGNTATNNGGGVMNRGKLWLRDSTSISGNGAGNGGGIGNAYTASIVLDDASSIHDNVARSQFGGGVDNDGTLTLNGSSSIRHNLAKQGGGVFNIGTVTLNDSSSIHHNRATSDDGGGVSNYAHLILNDVSSIRDNEASREGGGVRNYAYLTLNDASSIHHNSSGDDGGGVWNAGPLTLNDASSIHDNAAAWSGGGYQDRYSFVMGGRCGPSGNVHGNKPVDCSP